MLLENGTLVLVMDGARMALYRNVGKILQIKLEQLSEKRQHIAETALLGSAAPGRNFASNTARRSSYEGTDLHTQQEDRFIRRCVIRLEQEAAKNDKRAIIIAPPQALGMARSHYSAALRGLIIAEIDRDYAARPVKDIEALISAHDVK